jgi:dTMP kinase
MSFFITLEGVEGCGKSTQARRLYRRLNRKGIPARLVHEPGVTALGKRVARLLKWAQDINISPLAELLLFNVARAQLVEEEIRPALEKGEVVVCDRHADSTTAYQGYGRGLEMSTVAAVNRAGTGGLTPDLTILLDVPPEAGLARKHGERPDRFEAEAAAFHRRVREGYLKLAKQEPKRWLVIDATQAKDKVAGQIWERVSRLLSV